VITSWGRRPDSPLQGRWHDHPGERAAVQAKSDPGNVRKDLGSEDEDLKKAGRRVKDATKKDS